MAVSIERAVQRALRRRLEFAIPGVTVWDHWPDASAPLPDRAISIVRAGTRRDDLLQPTVASTENVHADIPDRNLASAVVDTATAIVALNTHKTLWNAELASTDSHRAADAANVITSPDAFDLGSAITLANESAARFNAHAGNGLYHDVGDSKNRITAGAAFDEGSLVALADQLRLRGNSHRVARYYWWRMRACDLPLQLDVWANYEIHRDEMMAYLEDALNSAYGGNGMTLSLQDGWENVRAEVLFDNPRLEDTARSAISREWRATYSGRADFCLLVRAQSARLARIIFNQTAYESTNVGVAPDTSSVAYSSSGTVEDYTP